MATRTQPHVIAPTKSTARILLVYKNFAAKAGISHIGLGVAGLNTSRTLRAAGIWCDVRPTNTAADIEMQLKAGLASANANDNHPYSHVVISAPWIPTVELQGLISRWPDVHFAVVSHSNVGFLMADPNGIQLLRDGLDLELGHHNFTVAGNSQKFCQAWATMYGRAVQYLPNLYDVSTIKHVGQRPPWNGGTLRVGTFGATRPLKNLVSAVAACVELAAMLKVDVEIWRNVGRAEGGGTVPGAIQQLTTGLKTVKVVDAGWATWPQFRQTIAGMHLLISPSYTESFNMVTADGVAEGVSSVVSEAIDWAPADWVANVDDVNAMARVARRLITDPHAVTEGQDSLKAYVKTGLTSWLGWLGAH